jgi:hypothetical protein
MKVDAGTASIRLILLNSAREPLFTFKCNAPTGLLGRVG